MGRKLIRNLKKSDYRKTSTEVIVTYHKYHCVRSVIPDMFVFVICSCYSGSVKHASLDLGVVNLSPTLAVELTKK